MNKKNSNFEIAKGLVYITQLSVSVIVPMIFGVWLSGYLLERFSLPDWVGLIIILLGVATGINSAAIYIKNYLKDLTKKKDGK